MGLFFFVKSAGQSVTPASPRTSARGAEQDSTFTWANARRPAPRGSSATKHKGNVLPVSFKNPSAWFWGWILQGSPNAVHDGPGLSGFSCPVR